MRESDLYPAVRDWLLKRGYTIYVEIFDADVVALKDGQITVVELKRCASQELFAQCQMRAVWADYVIAVVPTEPRFLSMFKHHGFGVMQLIGGKLRQRAAVRPQPWHRHKMRAYRFKRLAKVLPATNDDVAGLSSCAQLARQNERRWQEVRNG